MDSRQWRRLENVSPRGIAQSVDKMSEMHDWWCFIDGPESWAFGSWSHGKMHKLILLS